MNGYIKQSEWVGVGLLGFLLLTAPAQGASFDCGKASTKVEKMICAPNGFLSRTDEDLNSAYQWALMRVKNKQQVIREQRQWLKKVRNACEDMRCLSMVYDARIEDLVTQARNKGCYVLMPILDKGLRGNPLPVEPVCLALEKNLNQFCDQPPMACGLKVAPIFRDTFNLPKWTPLDPEANKELIEEFIRAPWQDRRNDGSEQRRWDESRPYIEQALAEKRLTFSQAKLDLYNLGEAQTAYRLDYGGCEEANDTHGSEPSTWGHLVVRPAPVQIQYAPEVVRPLFKHYFPFQREPLNEVFMYDGKTYSYGMGSHYDVYDDVNEIGFSVGRGERWTNPANNKVRLSMDNICRFQYQPIQGEQQ